MKIVVSVSIIILTILILLAINKFILEGPNKIDLAQNYPFLLETTWHQAGEYARYMESDSILGSTPVAIAQIAHYHKLNPVGRIDCFPSSGYQSINLDDYSFRHSQFVSFIDENTPDSSKEQVAKYLFCIAALTNDDFEASSRHISERLRYHLNCRVEFYSYDRKQYLNHRSKIQSIVTWEIDAKRPLILDFMDSNHFGHTVVIDGYVRKDDQFFVHLNFGLGGRYDGWYDLFDRIMKNRDDLHYRSFMTIIPDIENPFFEIIQDTSSITDNPFEDVIIQVEDSVVFPTDLPD